MSSEGLPCPKGSNGFKRKYESDEEQQENMYEDKECTLCSDETLTVNHTHMSSESIRVFSMEIGKTQHINLLSKKLVSNITPGTRKILLTDETLYNIWSYMGLTLDDLQIEIESIVGGKFNNLTRALSQMFLNGVDRLEVIVIAGIHNIEQGQAPSEIRKEIIELRDAVAAHSELVGHNPRSMISFSTVHFPPKLCSLDVHSNQVDWIPGPEFVNRRNEIEELNEMIKNINIENQVNYVKVHMEGIRIDRKRNVTKHKANPIKPIWREPRTFEKFHFAPESKIKIANMAAKLFRGGLGNTGNWDTAETE